MPPKTTIFDAIASGDPAKVKRKLAREPEALATVNDDGVSPLMLAVYHGRPDVVDAVLARGPELDVYACAALGRDDELRRLLGRSKKRVDAYSEDGFTPLHLAAYFDQAGAAAILLERGADIEARSKNPNLPHVTPLHSAAAGASTEVARLLLDAGADPNAVQPGGWTALHSAAANGNVELCRLLLKRKAKRSPMADDRTRPLDFAVEQGHKDVVALLKGGR